jgi:hypothetical protein
MIGSRPKLAVTIYGRWRHFATTSDDLLLHRIKGITHAEIAERLDITQVVVECSIAHVLTTIVRMKEGEKPKSCIYPNVEIAEAKLRATFQVDQAGQKTAYSFNSLGVSPTLRAWGGHTDFDAWLWHQGP